MALIDKDMLHEPDIRVHWGLHADRFSRHNADFTRMYPHWDRFNQKGTFHNRSLTTSA